MRKSLFFNQFAIQSESVSDDCLSNLAQLENEPMSERQLTVKHKTYRFLPGILSILVMLISFGLSAQNSCIVNIPQQSGNSSGDGDTGSNSADLTTSIGTYSFGDAQAVGDGGLEGVTLTEGISVEICFWGDMDNSDEDFSVNIEGKVIPVTDINNSPTSNNPQCRIFTLTAAEANTDFSNDGFIDISYQDFESGWFPTIVPDPDNPPPATICIANCPDGTDASNNFNARVSAVDFMYSFTWMQTDFNVCAGGPNVDLAGYLMGQGATAQDNFTGDGVNAAGTEFDPDMSNVGPNEITHQFTCEDGNVVTHVININVYAVPNMDIVDRVVTCDDASSNVSLLSLIADGSTTGGTFELVSGDGTINGNLLNINTPGCFEIRYFLPASLDFGNCAGVPIGTFSDNAFLYVPVNPAPQFTVSSGSGCWDGTTELSIGIDYTDPSYMPAHLWTVTSNGTNPIAPTISGETTASPTITIAPGSGPGLNLAGSIQICLVETVSGDPAGCPSGAAFDCPEMICRTISIIEATCSEECQLFPTSTPCPISVNPFFSIGCFGNSINFGDLLFPLYVTPVVPGLFVGGDSANGGTLAPLITCDVPEIRVSWDARLNFPTLAAFNTPIIDLLGLGGFCNVVNFCIPFPDGFCIDCSNDGNDLCIDPPLIDEICVRIGEFCPLGFIGGIICEATIQSVLIDPIQAAVEALSVGLVWADTDGDGAFDYVLQQGSNILDGSAQGTAMVPNNVEGSGTIRVRNLAAGIIPPTSPCQDPTPYNLLDLLPIGAIPIVGDIVETILTAAMCEINIAPSNFTDLDIIVINNFEPIFLNCPDSIVFTVGTDCETTPNWSAPTAVESCTDQIVDVQQTNGIDPASIQSAGRYEVEYTATSCNGLTTLCTFFVVVRPDPPQVQCPAPIIIGTDVDQCTAVVTGLTPLQGLGCNTTITWTAPGAMPAAGSNDASGSVFPLGETTVTYSLTYTDEFGVVQSSNCNFTVTVEDNQKPNAVCSDLEVQLDEAGMVTIFVADLDGGSSDNCTAVGDLDIQISKPGGVFGESVSFDCFEEGQQTVILRVFDASMNERRCLALVTVVDYFEGFTVSLDVPELCLPNNNEEQLNFANYVVIAEPDGTVISHMEEILDGDMVLGLFGITSFLPSENNPPGGTPGIINALTGEYTPGTGYGFITISYVLSIDGQVRPNDGLMSLEGCYTIANDVFELRQPLVLGQPECLCGDGEARAVELGVLTGGLEPYTIQYDGAWLDVDGTEDTDGEYTYDIANGHIVDDFTEDLGILRVVFTQPVWSITVVDARGCEIFRSGSCDIDDLTDGPIIDCMGANDFDTEVILCERQYEWMHALPFDNCAVTQYSYTITNPDGTIEGPFDLDALIYSDVDGIPLDELFEAEYEFENGTSIVSYYAEDAVGNFTTCSFSVIVEDNDPPYFINCPYPDVIIATETDQCDVFVNFALPLAEDNCGMPTVTQIDDTGLETGDRFPVGTTILTYQAVDAVGNKAICNVKVIVNHFDHAPTITCVADFSQGNDDWLCGAVVNNINALADELCSDELVKSYQVVQDGKVISTGLDDASGTYFEVGESQVTYRVQNQPLLLISEISQDADALIGGMNPPPIVNEFQCFSDTLFPLGNGDIGEGLVYYPSDDLIYHFSGATAGNQFFEEIYFPGKCVQPNHVPGDAYGPDPVGQIIGMVWDPVILNFIAMDINGNIFTVSTTGDYLQISTYDQAFPLAGYVIEGTTYYGVDQASNNLYEFVPGTGATVGAAIAMTSSGDAITTAIDIATDPLSGDVYIIYNTAASATAYIGTLDITTGNITELGDTFIDFAGITIDNEGQVYGVSSKTAGSDLYTIKCAIPGDDYIEITNFGPSVYDISCLLIDRTLPSGEIESYTVPAGIVLAPGDVMVLHYGPGVDNQNGPSYFLNYCEGTDQPANAAVSYSISYGNNMIDAMTMFADAQGGIIREDLFDTNTPEDFILAEDCLSLTLGEYNLIYPIPVANGTTASLQSEPKSIAECSFKVTVSDDESPKCMEIDNMNEYTGPALNTVEGECNQSTISIPEGDECILTEINVSIQGNIVGAENVTISLISPQNDTLELYNKLCAGDANVDLTFDDESENSASSICGSWTGDFRPQTEMLMKFYTSKLAGDWTIFVNIEQGSGAIFNMTSWSLESTCMMDWEMEDVVLENDPTVCDAVYTWIHPYYVDNCTFGSIRVDYLSDEDIDLPTSGLLLDNFRKGGFEVTETFAVGVTTVQYTLVDLAGNQSQCSFTVTVNDTELPVITSCPNDIFVGLEGGECEEVVFYNVEAMDNCGILSIVGFPASGTYFPIGTTPVVVTVTDVNGNTSLCEFNVIVLEYEPESNQLNCNNAINLSLDQNCEAVILADQLLEGNEYGCYDDYCITVTTETGIPHDNYFSVGDINQTFIVSIIDCNGDSTNSCWGTITIEEKFTPEIECPVDVTIACNEDPEKRDEFGVLITGEAFLLNCEPGAEIIYEDNAIDFGQCASPRMEITRTWIVTDADGNQDFCNQIITIDAINLIDIVFPEDIDLDMSLECFDVNLDSSLTHPDSTGHPTINGHLVSISGSLCMISLNTSDEIFDICPGSYEILRTWKIRNMCLPISATNPIEHTQIIKVLDTTAPKMVDCPDDMLLSVDPWGCQGSGFLPIPQNIYDQCSDVLFSAVIYGGGILEILGTPQAGDLQVFASNLRIGLHTVVYRTKDDCGNTRECAFDINVVDQTPPTVIALQNIVVSITSGTTEDDGYAKLFVESLDNGSFDGCGAVKLEIRRETDLCDIRGNTTYNTDGHPQDGSPNPNSPNYDPDGGAYVKFCCEDLTNTDLDVNGDGINDVGYVKVWLRVWDDGSDDGIFGNDGDQFNEAWAYVKIEDKLAPTLTCPADITILCADDTADLNVTGEAVAFGSCGTAPVEYNDIIVNLSTCNEGFVRRRWNVVGRTDVFCDQTITLEGIDAPVSVSFAQVGDTEVSGCPDQISLGEPTWNAGPCDVIGYTVETDTFLFEDGACYKLVNTYTVINWCDYDPNNPFWVETADFTDGLARHTQIVKVTDDTQPIIDNCEDQMFAINDHDDSDDDGIVCEAKLVLTNSATDPGSANCPTGWLKWQVFVDLWGDGTEDLEFSSYLPPFDSQFNDTNSNGIPDIYVAPTSNGETVSIPLPDIEGSMSNHKVRWIVSDGCQNNTSCETEFMVVDKKAPTPYCIDVSSAVMENDGTVDIWASDFNIGSYDNCSSIESLRYTFTDVAPEDDPTYDETLKSSSRTFDCDDVENSPVEVNMYVWDEKGNSDFCLVYFTVIDNNGTCGEGSQIAGRIVTEEDEEVSEVEVSLQANLPEYPRLSLTDEDGSFSFLGVSNNADFELRSGLDVDYMNGVSTLDLVKIQRHILGLELLDSPYKVIAADVNGDEKLKASDLLVLRKLILGIIVDIPTNESWRFVDKTQEFDDIYSPWPIKENIDIISLQEDKLDNDFIAVKIGDVNGNADPNFVADQKVQTRDLQSIGFAVDDAFVNKGEEVEVVFVTSENIDLRGYQFSMELDGLKFEDITGQAITVGTENVGLIDNRLVTMSYNESANTNILKGTELFTIKFIANRSARVSEMISLSSKLTANEAYLGADFEILQVELRFNEDEDVQFVNRLYQNEPNPFRKKTLIGFDLVNETEVTLSILSATGSVVRVVTIAGEKGQNTYELDVNQIGVSGLYFYRLECEGFLDTKKMILVR